MGNSFDTESIRAHDAARELPAVVGLVAVFSESTAPLPKPRAVRKATLVGREGDVDLVIDDHKISRRHVVIEPTDGGVLVTDLGSHNGVTIDGRAVVDRGSFAAIGATLRLGNTLLQVVSDVASHAISHGAHTGHGAGDRGKMGSLVGGAALDPLRRDIVKAGRSTASLLIKGESGVGKELVARAVHAASGRGGELITVNCAALPDNLIEAELFGHTRDAFSGTQRERAGLVRAADGGSLFLDEIGDLALNAQAKLLRVLEGGEVRPLGEDHAINVDVRVMCATNLSLERMVESGSFRRDLFHRIAALKISVPCLRDHREDIPQLVRHLMQDSQDCCRELTVEAMEKLMAWSWPGNVRELRNVVSALMMNAPDDPSAPLDVDSLPAELRQGVAQQGSKLDGRAVAATDDAALRAKIEEALRLTRGNVKRAAERLQMRRGGLYEQLRRLGIEPQTFRSR